MGTLKRIRNAKTRNILEGPTFTIQDVNVQSEEDLMFTSNMLTSLITTHSKNNRGRNPQTDQ